MNNNEQVATKLQRAFEECALARARLQTAIISKTGNIDTSFFAFHANFAAVYNLSLPNIELRSIPYGDDTLIITTSKWLVTAKNNRDTVEGGTLFEEFAIALASVGLL